MSTIFSFIHYFHNDVANQCIVFHPTYFTFFIIHAAESVAEYQIHL